MKKAVLMLLLVYSVFMCGCSGLVSNPNHVIPKDSYYYRSLLASKEAAFYDAVYEGVNGMQATIDVLEYDIPFKRAWEIVNRYLYFDCPEFFYFNCEYASTVNQDGILESLKMEYEYSDSEVFEKKKIIQDTTEHILSGLNQYMSDADKLNKLYMNLGGSIQYGHPKTNGQAMDDQSIAGGLIDGMAVCAGVSRSLQYLLYQAGIPSIYMTGSYQDQLHAWLMVYVDGAWSYVDLTKDLSNIQNNAQVTVLLDKSFLIDNGYAFKELLPVA